MAGELVKAQLSASMAQSNGDCPSLVRALVDCICKSANRPPEDHKWQQQKKKLYSQAFSILLDLDEPAYPSIPDRQQHNTLNLMEVLIDLQAADPQAAQHLQELLPLLDTASTIQIFDQHQSDEESLLEWERPLMPLTEHASLLSVLLSLRQHTAPVTATASSFNGSVVDPVDRRLLLASCPEQAEDNRLACIQPAPEGVDYADQAQELPKVPAGHPEGQDDATDVWGLNKHTNGWFPAFIKGACDSTPVDVCNQLPVTSAIRGDDASRPVEASMCSGLNFEAMGQTPDTRHPLLSLSKPAPQRLLSDGDAMCTLRVPTGDSKHEHEGADSPPSGLSWLFGVQASILDMGAQPGSCSWLQDVIPTAVDADTGDVPRDSEMQLAAFLPAPAWPDIHQVAANNVTPTTAGSSALGSQGCVNGSCSWAGFQHMEPRSLQQGLHQWHNRASQGPSKAYQGTPSPLSTEAKFAQPTGHRLGQQLTGSNHIETPAANRVANQSSGPQSGSHLVQMGLLALRGVLAAVEELSQLKSASCGRSASQSQLIHRLIQGAELRLRLQAFLIHHSHVGRLAHNTCLSSITAESRARSTACTALDAAQVAFVCCVEGLVKVYDARLQQLEDQLLAHPLQAPNGGTTSMATYSSPAAGASHTVPTALQLIGLLQPALTEIQLLATTCGCVPMDSANPGPVSASTLTEQRPFNAAEWLASPAAGLLAGLHADLAEGGLGLQVSCWMVVGLPPGQVLLAQLYTSLTHAHDSMADILRQLFTATASPLLVQLQEWLFRGRAIADAAGGMPILPAFLQHMAYESDVGGLHQRLLSRLAPQIGSLADRLAYIWHRELSSCDKVSAGSVLPASEASSNSVFPLAFNPAGLQQVSDAISQADSLCTQEAQHVLGLLQQRREAAAAATSLELLARYQEHAAHQEGDRQAKEAASAEVRIARANLLAQQRQAADDAERDRQRQRLAEVDAEQQTLLAAAAQDHAAAVAELQSELRKLQAVRGSTGCNSMLSGMPGSIVAAAAGAFPAADGVVQRHTSGDQHKGGKVGPTAVQQLQQQVARAQWRMKRLSLNMQRLQLLQGLEAQELEALRHVVGSARAAAATAAAAAPPQASRQAGIEQIATVEIDAAGTIPAPMTEDPQGQGADDIRGGAEPAFQAQTDAQGNLTATPSYGNHSHAKQGTKPRRQWGPEAPLPWPAAGMPSKRSPPVQLAHSTRSPTPTRGQQRAVGATNVLPVEPGQEPMLQTAATDTATHPKTRLPHAELAAGGDEIQLSPVEVCDLGELLPSDGGRKKAARRQWLTTATWQGMHVQQEQQEEQLLEAERQQLPWDPSSLLPSKQGSALFNLQAHHKSDKEEQNNAPVATVMEVCIAQPVLCHYRSTTRLVWQLMLQELRVMQLCAKLRQYFFWEAGDFAQQLKDGMLSRWQPMHAHASTQQGALLTWGISSQQLQAAWSEAVATSPGLTQHDTHGAVLSAERAKPGRDVLQSICFPEASAAAASQAASHQQLQQQQQQQQQEQQHVAGSRYGLGTGGIGDTLVLRAQVSWPASLVICGSDPTASTRQHQAPGSYSVHQGNSRTAADDSTSSVMQTYADIASVLMRMRVCAAALQQGWLGIGKPTTWKTGADGLNLTAVASAGPAAGNAALPSTVRATLARRLAALRSRTSEALHFVGALQRHAISMLHGTCWQRFERGMLHSGPLDVQQMAQHHQQYVQQAAVACFLPHIAAKSKKSADAKQHSSSARPSSMQPDSKLRLAVVHAFECCEHFATLIASFADTASSTATQSTVSATATQSILSATATPAAGAAGSSADTWPALKKAHQHLRAAMVAVYMMLVQAGQAGNSWHGVYDSSADDAGGGISEVTLCSSLLAELDCDWYAKLAKTYA